MRIGRAADLPWAIFVLLATALAAFFYAMRFHPRQVPAGFRFFGQLPPDHASAVGGTPLGLIFGLIALGIFIFAALLGLRKKLPWLHVGSVQRWLRAHIWLTLLTIPLVLLHSGFRLGSQMTEVLMGLYGIVMLSGIYGVVLQAKLPALMKERLPAEVVYEQIPNLKADLCAGAERMRRALRQEHQSSAAEIAVTAELVDLPKRRELGDAGAKLASTDPPTVVGAADRQTSESSVQETGHEKLSAEIVATFIETTLLPYLSARHGRKMRLSHEREAAEIFRHMKLRVGAEYRARVQQLEDWSEERRLLDRQMRYQHWLHGWLFVHVPLSFLLLLMTLWHGFVTLFRY